MGPGELFPFNSCALLLKMHKYYLHQFHLLNIKFKSVNNLLSGFYDMKEILFDSHPFP